MIFEEESECFNPRTRESATKDFCHTRLQVIVSIHALVRVRRYVLPSGVLGGRFQSTHS